MGHKFLYPGHAFRFDILLPAAVLATAIICLFIFGQAALADCPSCISHQYFGTVVANGRPASVGYTVYAVVNGVQVASTTTDSKGRWGYDVPFIVSAPSGSFVEFYVSGEYVGEAASCIAGSSTKLDLMVSAATGPTASTITTEAGTITASILGQADSLELSNGILTMAKQLSSADGRISIDFSANTAITTNGSLFTVSVQSSPPVPPPGVKLIEAYGFSPGGFTASPAATVTLKYDAAALPSAVDESNLYLAQWNGVSWANLSSTVNIVSKTVTAQVKSFSTMAILGKVNTPPPAQVIGSYILGRRIT